MEGHMHEHGPLYTSVPRVMFDEGGWMVVCCVGVVLVLCWCCCIRLSFLWSDASHFHSNCVCVLDDS